MNTAQRQALVAVLLLISSGVLFVIMNTMVKVMTATVDTMVITWGRYFFHVAFVVLLFPRTVLGVFRSGQIVVQVGRSVLLLGSTVTNFLALSLMSLADVSAIIFTAPILVAFLAVLLLKERVGGWRWVLIGLGFSGAMIIIQPGGGGFGLGAVLSLGCACCYAFYQITTRIVREAEPLVSLLYGGLVGVVVISLVVPFHWQPLSLGEWATLVVIGSLGAAGHLLVILALQRAEASKMAPFTYVQLVWAMLASFLVLGDPPSPATLVGAAVIVTSGLLLYRLDLREAATQRSAESRETTAH
jgi:drug/metabolite transporter (DMT)-like permease